MHPELIVPPRAELIMNNGDRKTASISRGGACVSLMITPIKTLGILLKGYIRLEAFHTPSSTRSSQYPSCPTFDETAPMEDPMMLVSDTSVLPQSALQSANPRKRPRFEEDTAPEVSTPEIEVGFMSGLQLSQTNISRLARRPGQRPKQGHGWWCYGPAAR